MPRTTRNGNPDLQVNVASPPGWTYAPGDTIIGTVVRSSSITTPEATVKIALLGRIKTKIVESSSESSREYRERKQLFGATTASQIVSRGPLHIPPKQEHGGDNDVLSWSFSIAIPTQSREGLTSRPAGEGGGRSSANRTLPGSFYSSDYGFSTSSEAFVEYYLEAQLRYDRKGSQHVVKSTSPITLGRFPGTELLSYNIKEHTVDKKAYSQRLLPGMENADLTMKQKAQRFFGSSKIPELHYKVEFTWPCCVQLNNPSPLPFVLNIIPQPEKNSAGIRDVGHKIRLTSIRLCIKSKTGVTAPGNFSINSTHYDDHSSRYDLQAELAFKDLETPILFSSEKENKPVNIGNLLQLVLLSNGLTAGKRRLSRISNLYPSFSTIGITHSHRWDMEVILNIAGETNKVLISSALKILPPGEVGKRRG